MLFVVRPFLCWWLVSSTHARSHVFRAHVDAFRLGSAWSRLVLMADEVYQENIYQSKTPFVSCKKVRYSTLNT